jgi:type IV pilus assembly protein PilC
MKWRKSYKWKRRDILVFLEQLGLYISAGLALDRTLQLLEEFAHANRKSSIATLLKDIQKGVAFSKTFSDHISSQGILVGIIRQGERSGELGKAFVSAHALLEKRDELSKKCISALAYPCVIGVFALVLTIGLVKGIMPQIIPLLLSLHVQLPLLTRIVIHVSQGFITYGVYVGVVLLGLVYTFRFIFGKYLVFRRSVHFVMLGLPLFGSILRTYSQALFLRACGSLIESGVSASQAYENASKGVSLIPFRLSLESLHPALEQGIQMASVFRNKELHMDPFVPALISAGEASATLGAACIRAADILDKSLDHSLKRVTSMIEPLMMIVMGCAIGAIALSIMLPIYDISKVLQR